MEPKRGGRQGRRGGCINVKRKMTTKKEGDTHLWNGNNNKMCCGNGNILEFIWKSI
jgi:hypothetical protein